MAASASMTGKTVLITGGTGGIGRAAAIGLAGHGCPRRDHGSRPGRAQRAAAEIASESGNGTVDVFVADMSSQAEVRRLADEVLAAYPRLDVLLNNVGGFWAHRHVTADGLEHTFALNHLAPFLLTSLLAGSADRQRTGPGRHRVVRRPVDGQDRLRRPDGRAELLRAAGLQPVEAGQRDVHLRARPATRGHRRHRHRAASRRHQHRLQRGGSGPGPRSSPSCARSWRAPNEGRDTSVYLASSPDAEGVTGQYFAKRKPKRVEPVVLRHGDDRPAVAGQRRPRRPPNPCTELTKRGEAARLHPGKGNHHAYRP